MCSFRYMCLIKTSMYSGLMAQVYRCQKSTIVHSPWVFLFLFICFFLFAKKMSHPHKFKSCYLVGFCFIRFFFCHNWEIFGNFWVNRLEMGLMNRNAKGTTHKNMQIIQEAETVSAQMMSRQGFSTRCLETTFWTFEQSREVINT